jgi:filamentous hemagglutinin family protein
MKSTIVYLIKICLYSFGFICISNKISSAQVTSDNTVNTQVNQNGTVVEITGGETRDSNLFHSFQEFSIPTGNEAFFNNGSAIANIFSRVTGNTVSQIEGLIRANGSANLFLINPAGIIFGENASLDIGGSFLATTANSIQFNDGEFSAIAPEEEPILTISVPIGLSFDESPGEIINNSVANERRGLEVATGNNITLLGGNISFEAGTVTAPGGKVDLGGLSAAGTVNIADDGSLAFPNNVAQADLSLEAGIVDVRGSGGSININAGNVELKAGDLGSSAVAASTAVGSKVTEAQAGNITIDATNKIVINDSTVANVVDFDTEGDAGGISINTGSLSLTNGGAVNASTYGQGNAGQVKITAQDTVDIGGENLEGFPSGVDSSVDSEATGNAGGVSIKTSSLSLTNGGFINASTFSQGNAGLVEVNAQNTIVIDGESSQGFISGIGSQVNFEATGDAGGVNLTTSSLSLMNGGVINASTLGQGNAGTLEIMAKDTISIDGESSAGFITAITSTVGSTLNSEATGNAGGIRITTNSLFLSNGGQVDASTFGQGNAGTLEIMAKDTISIDGKSLEGSVSIAASKVLPEAVGNAGGVKITTDFLSLTNGGQANASTLGQGNAGELIVKADSLSLDNNAKIIAATESGFGGIVDLQITDGIILKDNSSISAQAFQKADGGNLNIDAGFIVALPNGNNDILASAESGKGGNITINTQGLFAPNNSINASSELGIDGQIQINTPDINFQKELEQLELEILTAQEAIAGSCLAHSNRQGSFIVNNSARLPKSPDSNYSDIDSTLTGISSLPATAKQPEAVEESDALRAGYANRQPNVSMLPAETMVKTENGRVFLVAAPYAKRDAPPGVNPLGYPLGQEPKSLLCPKN